MAAKRAGKRKSKESAAQASVGIIGGSGLYSMSGLTDTREIRVKTPFGEPSDAIVLGTLKEDLRPGEFLVPNQFFDRTKNRTSTFFGNGLVAHVAFAHPTCGQLSGILADAC